MKHRRIINAAAITVAAIAALRLYLFFNPRPPPPDLRSHQALGELMATEAMALESGGGLVVIARETLEFEVPATKAQLQSFQAALKKAGRSVSLERPVRVDPLRAMGVPPGEFFDLIRQGKENDVFVSFLGPPALTGEQIAKLGTKRPKILALCPGNAPARVNLKALFDQNLLSLVIVSQPGAPATPGPGNAKAAFDQMFKVINSANLTELQSFAATKGDNQ